MSRKAAPDIHVGTSGWHYLPWSGTFYPQDLKPKDFLSYYVTRFDTTEINNSFYRLPTEKAVESWHDHTPEGFLFAWKISRLITHLKRLKDVEENVAYVFERMGGLKDKLGPVLVQLPPTFVAGPERRERLARLLSLIPAGRQATVEFRHPGWYDETTFALLRDHNASLCISDHAAAPAPWEVTADFVYVRAHGADGRYAGSYGPGILKGWARTIARWRSEGRSVHVYFDNDIKSAAPGDARTLLRILEERSVA